ncbi:hypothetical protein Bwad002_11660 [Bilophila wadsworthia]
MAGQAPAAEHPNGNLPYRRTRVEIFWIVLALEMEMEKRWSAIGRGKEPVPSVVSEQGKILVAGFPVESVRDVQKYLSGGPDDVAHFEREVGLPERAGGPGQRGKGVQAEEEREVTHEGTSSSTSWRIPCGRAKGPSVCQTEDDAGLRYDRDQTPARIVYELADKK